MKSVGSCLCILPLTSLLALGALSGCANSGSATKPPKVAGIDPADPIAISAVRERAIEVIQQAAADPDPVQRANAVEAASLAPVRLEVVIQQGITDHNPAVRTVAAMTIARAQLVELCELARPLLNDPSAHVQSAAIFALASRRSSS